jgi:hypothetical protein
MFSQVPKEYQAKTLFQFYFSSIPPQIMILASYRNGLQFDLPSLQVSIEKLLISCTSAKLNKATKQSIVYS